MLIPGEIVVDNFAGGGGASTGMELGLNRHVDIAINHDQDAIDMHKINHPETKHYCESVWDVDPVEACNNRPVGLAWFSPDCKHFSKAKGTTMKYRKKPIEIEAIEWTGENLFEVITFTDGKPDLTTMTALDGWESYSKVVAEEGLKIYTLEGVMNASIGDYIIKGVQGEFYPCKPDIFHKTYDAC